MQIFPEKYNFSRNRQKYKAIDIVRELVYILETGLPWRKYRGNVNWRTLYYHFQFFTTNKIFKNAYKLMLLEYMKNDKWKKIKYQSIDSTFIQNQYGVDCIGRNTYYKSKRGTKVTLITDNNGIPVAASFDKGNMHDIKLVDSALNNIIIDTNTNGVKNNRRYKQYILADKAYDSKENRKKLQDKGYTCIIDHNKRNIKDAPRIKKFTPIEKEIYKKRIKIENAFCYLKKNRRIGMRYDKSITAYSSFFYLALCKLIAKYITN